MPPEELADVVQAVERVSRPFPRALPCLPRALATQLLLRRRGGGASLCFGVARDGDGPLTAHAWVELDGEILIGAVPELERFKLVKSWPGPPAP